VSDLFHVRHVPGVVMGPGTSAASHAPDEWVAVEQVEAAARAYQALAGRYLA
jgi:acetylornithine deacetylase/succinyl-diaminopimelate desuccinylase-like protein